MALKTQNVRFEHTIKKSKMKRLVLIAIVVLVAGVASAQSKLAHLDSQKIMEAMPSYKDAVKKLEQFQKDGYDELEAMEADFNAAVAAYQQKVQSGNMTPTLQQIEEGKLSKKEQAIVERQQSLQQELQAYSQELNQPILDRVKAAVKLVSDRSKYDYVFEISALMIHNGPDITAEVITEILKLESTTTTVTTPN